MSWINVEDKLPDTLEVRILLEDGSEINCWAQSDGEYYWKGGGAGIFIPSNNVTHWMPLQKKQSTNEQ
jgi:hypothetical protein